MHKHTIPPIDGTVSFRRWLGGADPPLIRAGSPRSPARTGFRGYPPRRSNDTPPRDMALRVRAAMLRRARPHPVATARSGSLTAGGSPPPGFHCTLPSLHRFQYLGALGATPCRRPVATRIVAGALARPYWSP